MQVDPLCAVMAIFVGNHYKAVKILYWDRNGFAKPSTKDPRRRLRVETTLLPMAPLVRS